MEQALVFGCLAYQSTLVITGTCMPFAKALEKTKVVVVLVKITALATHSQLKTSLLTLCHCLLVIAGNHPNSCFLRARFLQITLF